MKYRYGWAAVAVLLGGCIRTEYELELTPDGKTMQRTLYVQRHGSASDPEFEEEIDRLAEEYQVERPASRSRQYWQGHFEARTPNDLGGFGTYTRWDTPLGSATAYVERFRGDDDTASVFRRRETAARRLVDLVIGWLESELQNDPQWPTLHKFLNEDFRRDVINVSVDTWLQHRLGRKDEPATPVVSVLHYLVEHGYLTPEEIPVIRRAMHDTGREEYGRILEWLRQLIVHRMGDEASPPELGFLATREQLETSLRAFLETTDEYGVLFRAWQEKLQADPTTTRPDAFLVVGELLKQIFVGVIQLGGDQLTITLHLERPPIFTNGETWDDSGEIHWPTHLLPPDEGSPLLAYAVWDEPHEDAQTKIFGKTILQGKSLFDYCVWYHGLTVPERQEWDALLASLPSQPDRAGTLTNFRFREEPATTAAEHRIAAPACDLILPAWKP